jgi:uncharacterized protein YbcV (DUF1398 family)
MQTEVTQAIQTCSAQSLAGQITFPEVVRRLTELGVERYHADYSRSETTYYLATGESVVVPTPHEERPIAAEFSAEQVEAAIRGSQRGEVAYREFVPLTMAAGCVGYFVQIAGRQALYFGRNGEIHREPFPK